MTSSSEKTMPKIISIRGRAKATVPVKLTRNEIAEIMKCQSDPIHFINNYVAMSHPIFGVKPMPLEQHHADYIETLNKSKNVIAMMPRQSGTTSRTLGFLLWEALFNINQTIVIQGLSVSNTKYMCDTFQQMIQGLPAFLAPAVKLSRRTAIEFENGSRIFINVASATALKGVTFTRLFVDTFAMVPPMIQKDLWLSAAALVPHGGRIILASTPNGKNNMFYNIWCDSQRPQSTFVPFKRTADDLPYTDAWKQMVRQQVGDQVWRREFMCEFS